MRHDIDGKDIARDDGQAAVSLPQALDELLYAPPDVLGSRRLAHKLMDALGGFLGREGFTDDVYGLDPFLILLPSRVCLDLLLFGSLVVGHFSIYRQLRCCSTGQHSSGFGFC